MTDRLSAIVDAVRQRVEDELRQQLSALTAEHNRALDEALREAARAAGQEAQANEARWSGLLAEARSQAEQTAASAAAAARAEATAAVRAEYEAQRVSDRSAGEAFRTRLSQDLDGAATLSAVLDALAEAAAAEAGGVLFISKRGSVERWSTRAAASGQVPSEWVDAAASAARAGAALRRGDLFAVPVLLDRTAVAVIVGIEPAGPHSALEGLATAGGARLTAVTASRLVQAERWAGGMAPLHGWRTTGPADFPSEAL
jgi:hypothetical protein